MRLLTAQPLAAPWNAPSRLALATPDGSGATIHPSVVDMGTPWNGYRYWLADTPYAGGDNQLENPAIWASNNRTNWVVPPGVTNPLVPAPGVLVGFHSDTELVWDPDGARMVMYYRKALFTSGAVTSIELHTLTSTNGATWTGGKVADIPVTGGRLSPAVVRVSAGLWRMWLWGGSDGTVTTRTAASPLGPWGEPAPVTLDGGPLLGWHGDVIRSGSGYLMAYSNNDLTTMLAASSADGIAWTTRPAIMARIASGRWDRAIYRPTLTLGPEAGFVSVWYSAVSPISPGGYAIGFTRVPLSLWAA